MVELHWNIQLTFDLIVKITKLSVHNYLIIMCCFSVISQMTFELYQTRTTEVVVLSFNLLCYTLFYEHFLAI